MMVRFKAEIKKFLNKGEKSGWTYIDVPQHLANQLKPGERRGFRVKGKLDEYLFDYISLVPMGEGDFIMALNADIRRSVRKQKGDMLEVQLEVDLQEKPLSGDFLVCLEDEPRALEFFRTLPKGHQRYFSNWIASAKTDITKTKRISMAVNALAMGLGYSEMMRMNKNKSLQ